MKNDLFEKADFLQRLFDSVPSFLFVVDSDVRVFHFNAAARSLLGPERESVLMKRAGEALHCIHSRDVPEGCGRGPHCRACVVRNSVNRAFNGERVLREIARVVLFLNGQTAEVHLLITTSLMEYEGNRFALLIMEDVSELKKAEESLRKRTQQLEALNRELEAFSYSAAHDLRAPLVAISGFSRALQEDYSDVLEEQGKDYLNRISAAGQRMTQLIEDLLKLSRLSSSDLIRERVDMSRIAGEVASELGNSAPGKNAEIHIPDGIVADCDARLMRVVLENLFGNAWKYTAEADRPRIEFGARQHDGRTVYFVSDNGAGFDMVYADKLFSPFHRLHSAERFPGSGVGLATVRRIIHRHGGRIWAEGAPNKGATIYFTLNETG